MKAPEPSARKIEVVPSEVAAEISKRTTLFMVSMGAGPAAMRSTLFAEDVLGSNTGHYPRHAKRYRDFASSSPPAERAHSGLPRSLPGM